MPAAQLHEPSRYQPQKRLELVFRCGYVDHWSIRLGPTTEAGRQAGRPDGRGRDARRDARTPPRCETLRKECGLTAFTAPGVVQASGTDRLSTAYALARPILLGLAAIPLIPATWRAALRVFLKTLDEVTATIQAGEVTETFKAGKDQLAAGTEPEQVEMEPKLPVG